MTLCDSMESSPPGSSVHGILQARTLKWVAMTSLKSSSWPRDRIPVSWVSCTGRWVLVPLLPPVSIWSEHSSTIVGTFFGIALLWDWNESWTYPVLWPFLRFPNLLAYYSWKPSTSLPCYQYYSRPSSVSLNWSSTITSWLISQPLLLLLCGLSSTEWSFMHISHHVIVLLLKPLSRFLLHID